MRTIKCYSIATLKACRSDCGNMITLGNADEGIMSRALEKMMEDSNWEDDGVELAQYPSKSYDGFDSETVPSLKISIEDNKFVAIIQIADGVDLEAPIESKRGDKLLPAILSWITGQYSDGWGEGFEQHPICSYTDDDYEDEEVWDEESDCYITERCPVTVNVDLFVSPWWPGFKFRDIQKNF